MVQLVVVLVGHVGVAPGHEDELAIGVEGGVGNQPTPNVSGKIADVATLVLREGGVAWEHLAAGVVHGGGVVPLHVKVAVEVDPEGVLRTLFAVLRLDVPI